MISHAFFRNTALPLIYLAYVFFNKNQSLYKHVIHASIIAAPLTYMVITKTWEKPGSFIQYYILYIYLLYIIDQKDSSYRFTASVCTVAAVGYFYEVPKWLAIDILEPIRSSRHSLVLFEWGFLSAILYLIYFMNPKITPTRLLALMVYGLYCYIYFFHLPTLGRMAKLFHIQGLVFKRLPTIFFTLTWLRKKRPHIASMRP